MHLKNFTLSFIIAVCCAITVLTSCDDDASQFGLNVLPGDDKIEVKEYDSIAVYKKQIFFNQEKLPLTDLAYLGFIKDPLLGEVKASLFTNFYRITYVDNLKKLAFSSFVSLDVILRIDSTRYNGGAGSTVTYDIFPMTKKLSLDSSYTYNFNPGLYFEKSNSLASFTVNMDSIKKTKSMTIKLPDDFAKRFFEYDSLQLDTIDKNEPGICIIPRSYTGSGLMPLIDLNYTNSTLPSTYMLLKYVKDKTDTTSIMFGFTSLVPASNNQKVFTYPKANYIQYNYNASTVNSFMKGNTNDSLLYIMNFGGSKVELDFSQLSSFPNRERTVVSKAELVLPYVNSYYKSSYTNVTPLKLYLSDSLTEKYFSYELLYATVGSASILDTVNKVYKLDVTNYVQAMFANKAYLDSTKTPINKLIVSASNVLMLHHAILSKNKKATLKIKYTSFKN